MSVGYDKPVVSSVVFIPHAGAYKYAICTELMLLELAILVHLIWTLVQKFARWALSL